MNEGHPICMDKYAYDLPQDRIAEYPVEERDTSRLLIMQGDHPAEDVFNKLPEYLPDGGMMVFNDTRVIRARLVFRKETGARIEVFCLEPVLPTSEIAKAFEARSGVSWKCLIGNAKKWRSGKLSMLLDAPQGKINFEAERTADADGAFLVHFTWDPPDMALAEVLEAAGKVPLPPYIEREAEEGDLNSYQTIYAKQDGSVAAPTAGLHFTKNVLDALKRKSIQAGHVTLHVSAGTFKPVSHDDIRDHEMHREQIIVERTLIKSLLNNDGKLTAVGTTSMRTLESLYWFGHALASDTEAEFCVKQWQPYEKAPDISTEESLNNILKHMDQKGIDEISGITSLIIIPGYKFRIVDILVTNFHMPKSTLLLLVAAFAGEAWQHAYAYALEHGFRFLSYGDSCLFFRKD
ncbi:MAG: S-adenosylmethionine:tRNA ribosyltransferase-isomerase [Bacteroidetes bacterium]|nr:MAG: S-adenosylmethionine:tRNA ribosyltransferase-isomerase [Bacteroidota bacterium]